MSARIYQFPTRERPRQTPDTEPHPSRGRSFSLAAEMARSKAVAHFANTICDEMILGKLTQDEAFGKIQGFLERQDRA